MILLKVYLIVVFYYYIPFNKLIIFYRFKDIFQEMDIDLRHDITYRDIDQGLQSQKNEILNLCVQLRVNEFIRADYEELVDLVELYLSDEPQAVQIRRPGAIHKARFMGKLLYAIKMDLLSNKIIREFPAGTVFGKNKNCQDQKIERFVKFAIFCYVSWWFTSPVPAYAPTNDLAFLQNLEHYRQFDEPLVQAALAKFARHTWYLSQELVPLSLFALGLAAEEKQKMADKLLSTSREAVSTRTGAGFGRPRLPPIPSSIAEADLTTFVGPDSWRFFDMTKIRSSFLTKPVGQWPMDPEFMRGKEIVDSFSVVNDAAERAVKLTGDFMDSARKEDNFQNILQVVEITRKSVPNQRKRKKENPVD